MELSGLMNLYHRAIHSKTLVNGSLFSLFSFFGQGIGFVLLILLANYIRPAEYGQLSLFTTVVTFAGFIMAFSTRGYPGVTFFKKDAENFKKDFSATIILGLVSVALLALPILFYGDWLGEKLELSKQLLWYVLIVSFFSLVFTLQQDYLRIKEDVIRYGIYNCSNAALNFALSLILVITFEQSWMGRVNAFVICAVLFGIMSCIFFFQRDLIRINIPWKNYRDALAWGLPMMPHVATGWLRQGLDRYIINYFYSVYEVGVFSFAMNLANIIIMIGSAFNSTNSVTLFQVLSDKTLTNEQKRLKLSRQSRIIFLIYLIATFTVLISMSFFTHIALPKYRESIPFMWVLGFNGLGNCIYFLYCNYLFYYGKTKTLMYITFSTSLIHVGLSFALTRYSLYCTAIVCGSVMALMTLMVILQAKKLIREHLA